MSCVSTLQNAYTKAQLGYRIRSLPVLPYNVHILRAYVPAVIVTVSRFLTEASPYFSRLPLPSDDITYVRVS